MIGRLRGRLAERQDPFIVVDVGGVGYEVEVTTAVLAHLGPQGAECTVHTHLIVRDDAHVLFGFASLAERSLFRDLIRVNGIGARTALGIVSGIAVSDFARCIRDEDRATLMRLPGIGRKSADRLIMEMKDRLIAHDPLGGASASAVGDGRVVSSVDPVAEAASALAALGYRPAEVSRMLHGLDGGDSEAMIRQALRQALRP